MPDCFAAPLVRVLQPWLKEVEARSEARQHQDGHQQVEGDEPVQEQQGHDCCGGGVVVVVGGVQERQREVEGGTAEQGKEVRCWVEGVARVALSGKILAK